MGGEFFPAAPNMRAYSFSLRGNEMYEKRNYKEAVTEYSKALMVAQPGLDPTSANDFSALIFSNRSASYYMLKMYQDAEKDADQIIRIRPQWPKGYFRRAEALLALHRYEEAVDYYQAALERDSDNTQISSKLAKALIQKDNAAMGLSIIQLLPGRDIATERNITTPIQNRIYEYGEMMRNLIYIVADLDTRQCMVVDACWDVDGIIRFTKEQGFDIVAAAVTHYHFDHVGGTPPPPYDSLPIKVTGLATLLKKIPNIKVYVHPLDIPYIQQSNNIPGSRMTATCNDMTTRIQIGARTSIQFIHTPGHTPGSQSILINDSRILTGDTLLGGICGRTDLPGGNRECMQHTLRHVLGALDDRIVVLPGHDYGSEWSTIGIERDKGCLGDDLVGFGFHSHDTRESMESLSTIQTSSTATGFSSSSSVWSDHEDDSNVSTSKSTNSNSGMSLYSLSISSMTSLAKRTSLKRR